MGRLFLWRLVLSADEATLRGKAERPIPVQSSAYWLSMPGEYQALSKVCIRRALADSQQDDRAGSSRNRMRMSRSLTPARTICSLSPLREDHDPVASGLTDSGPHAVAVPGPRHGS